MLVFVSVPASFWRALLAPELALFDATRSKTLKELILRWDIFALDRDFAGKKKKKITFNLEGVHESRMLHDRGMDELEV